MKFICLVVSYVYIHTQLYVWLYHMCIYIHSYMSGCIICVYTYTVICLVVSYVYIHTQLYVWLYHMCIYIHSYMSGCIICVYTYTVICLVLSCVYTYIHRGISKVGLLKNSAHNANVYT